MVSLVPSVLLFLWIYCVASDDKFGNLPVFTTSPEDTFLPRDQQLTLKCFATGYPPPSITWYKDGEIVQTHRDKPGTSNRITNHGELIILRFGVSDEGVYYCNASNIHGWAKSSNATVLSAFFNTDLAKGPESKSVKAGDTVVLQCFPPNGLPRPVVSWFRDGSAINEGERFQIVDSSNLRIQPVKLSDTGSYHCRAENFAGRWDSNPSMLTVQRKTRFTSIPGNKQAIVGDSVDVQCFASDIPNSTIVWRKSTGKMRAKLWNKRNLRIENVQLSDAGDYVCEVKNAHGSAEAIAHLSVISLPSFTVTPDDKTTLLGGSAKFDCVASGTPKPSVRWIHNGETFWVPSGFKPSSLGRIQVYPNGTLVINSVTSSDEGIYECRASQLAGIVKSLSHLFIETPFFQPLPVIELVPQNLTLYSGMIATFPCQASVLRYPQFSPTFNDPLSWEIMTHWFINGVPISPPNDRRIVLFNTGSLQLHAVRPSDNGVYTCEVEIDGMNKDGLSTVKASWSAYLTVVENIPETESSDINFEGKTVDNLLPYPPERVELLSVGDTWITILIEQPDINTSISRPEWPSEFRVEYAESNASSGWQIAWYSIKAREIRLQHLKPQTGYYVLVRGVNKHGIGKPKILDQIVYTLASYAREETDQLQILTKLQTIHFSPLQSKPLSPSEALVEWTICGPKSSLSEVNAHKLMAKPVSLSHCLSVDMKINGYVLQYQEGKPASLEAACSSSDASSDFYDTDDFFHCSLSELRDTYDLSLNPPLSLTREYVDVNADIVDLNTFDKRAVIPELKPFTCYSVEVLPVARHPIFGHLFGQRSQSVNVLTYDSSPVGAPEVYKASWTQNGTVLELYWHPPPTWEQGGVLTGYTMRIIGSSTASNRNINFGPNQQSYRLRGLDLWSNYTIYLAALNCRGEGIRSLPVQVFANSILDPLTNRLDRKSLNVVNQGGHYRRVIFNGREEATENLLLASVQSQPKAELIENNFSEDRGSLIREPWFIVSAVAFSLLWILVVLGLILCGRHRSRRHRRRATVLDPVDVGTVTKNGRLGPASETYPLSLASTPLLPTSTPDMNGLNGINPLSTPDPLFYSDQRKLGNGFTQQNGLIPVVSFPGSVVCNGSVQPTFTYYPHYSLGPQSAHVDGGKTSYITSSSIPMPLQTNGVQGYQPGDAHRPNIPMTVVSTKGGQLPNQSGATAGLIADEIPEDTVSPYASVPVLQQMAYERNPSGLGSAHPPVSGVRQLSLAEIIPPPPDYPPPSVPSCSPPLAPSAACRTGAAWPQGSGSGDDSAYYAHSDLQSAISQEAEGSGTKLWPIKGPESSNATSGVPLDWSLHENSSVLNTSRPVLISSHEQTNGYVG